MIRKAFLPFAAFAVLTVPTTRVAAQGMDDPNNKVAGGGVATGWHGRTDVDRRSNAAPSLTEVKFVAMGDGFHRNALPSLRANLVVIETQLIAGAIDSHG